MAMEETDVTAKNDTVDAVHFRDHVAKVARGAVRKAINEAIAWIESDPEEFFLYKYPRECEERTQHRLQMNRITGLDATGPTSSTKGRHNSVRAVTETSAKCIDWLRIDDFSLHQLVQLVYNYLSLWRLTPNTNYMVRLENDAVHQEPQGSTYSLHALFTRQPKRELVRCNPLTMAQVNFKVHVSHLLPKFYPVMMTYRFENCNRDYYAIGNRRISRLDFQRFFIDMALETKLGFYAQLLKTLAYATEQKFADNQNGIRRGGKRSVDHARENRLKSSGMLCICAKAKSLKQQDVSNAKAEEVREVESESSLDADSSDLQQNDKKTINESCEKVNSYFEFLNVNESEESESAIADDE